MIIRSAGQVLVKRVGAADHRDRAARNPTIGIGIGRRAGDGLWTYATKSRDAYFDVEAEKVETEMVEKWEKFGKSGTSVIRLFTRAWKALTALAPP